MCMHKCIDVKFETVIHVFKSCERARINIVHFK